MHTTLILNRSDREVVRQVSPIDYIYETLSGRQAVRRIAFVDTETTGLGQADLPWEIGVVVLDVADNGAPCSIVRAIIELQEPDQPLSSAIRELCGVDDEDLAGKSFDVERVTRALRECDAIVACNAKFDFSMLSKTDDFAWLVDDDAPVWVDSAWLNIPGSHLSQRQEVLAALNGWMYRAHRAMDDAAALAMLCCLTIDEDGERPSSRIMREATSPEVLCGVSIPFAAKDSIKAVGGWRWDPAGKIWWKSTRGSTFDAISQEARAACAPYPTCVMQCDVNAREKCMIGCDDFILRWSRPTASVATVHAK